MSLSKAFLQEELLVKMTYRTLYVSINAPAFYIFNALSICVIYQYASCFHDLNVDLMP